MFQIFLNFVIIFIPSISCLWMHPRSLAKTIALVYDPVRHTYKIQWMISRKQWSKLFHFLLTVGAVSKTIRVNILYSGDSRNCITWQEVQHSKDARYIQHVLNRTKSRKLFKQSKSQYLCNCKSFIQARWRGVKKLSEFKFS